MDGETIGFAAASPTVEEGTNYCTTNWCTTAGASLFTYAEGEDHGTFDVCDAVYAAPVLPDVIPASITEVRSGEKIRVLARDQKPQEISSGSLWRNVAGRVCFACDLTRLHRHKHRHVSFMKEQSCFRDRSHSSRGSGAPVLLVITSIRTFSLFSPAMPCRPVHSSRHFT